MTTGFFSVVFGVETVRTGVDGGEEAHPGQGVFSVSVWVVGAHLQCRTCRYTTHAHASSWGPLVARRPERCPRCRSTHWNIVIIISLSYITSFLQHKNRSLTMITICLNVNIQYLLHFQIKLFLNYFLSSSSHIKRRKRENKELLVPMTVKKKRDACKAKTSRRRCIAEDEKM